MKHAWEIDRRIRDDEGAFLLDIRDNRLLIHPGDARMEVPGIDPRRQQAVLFVHERERTIRFRRYDRSLRRWRVETQTAPSQKRHLLVGMDEARLFACPLPRGASHVEAAHRVLAPGEVHEKRRMGEKVVRQGEWFFSKVTDGAVLAALRHVVPDRKVGIGARGRRGRPHVVDERVFLDGREYVRGAVRHPDHRVRKLAVWHLVTVNTEDTETGAQPDGMTWID